MDSIAGSLVKRKVFIVLYSSDVVHSQRRDKIDLTVLQGDDGSVGIRLNFEVYLLDVGLCAIILIIVDKLKGLSGDISALQLVGAGTDGLIHKVAACGNGFLAADTEIDTADQCQEVRKRIVEMCNKGVLIGSLNGLDGCSIVGSIGLGHYPVECINNVVCGQQLAVVEIYIVAELKRVGQPVLANFPALSYIRLYLVGGAAFAFYQHTEQLGLYHQGVAIRCRRGVKAGRGREQGEGDGLFSAVYGCAFARAAACYKA